MNKILGTLSKNKFLNNTFYLISGTVFSQVILFAFSPLLSRIYSVSDFGFFANYNAWVSFFAIISNFRYEHAIVLSKGIKETYIDTSLVLILSSISVVFITFFFYLIHFVEFNSNFLISFQNLGYFIPIGVLGVCIYSVAIQLFSKRQEFKKISSFAIVQIIFTVSFQVLLGSLKIQNGLIISTIIGFYLTISIMIFNLSDLIRFSLVWKLVNRDTLIKSVKKNVSFPKYILFTDLMMTIVQQFASVFILLLFNPVFAGLFSFTIRIIRVPLVVISNSLTSVLRQKLVEYKHANQNMVNIYINILKTMIGISIIPLLIIFLFSDFLFVFFFGKQWIQAGIVSKYLIFGVMSEFISTPLSFFFIILGKQKISFNIQLVGFMFLIFGTLFGKFIMGDFFYTCIIISIVMLFSALTNIYFSYKMVKNNASNG